MGLDGLPLIIQVLVKMGHWPKAYEVGYSLRTAVFDAISRRISITIISNDPDDTMLFYPSPNGPEVPPPGNSRFGENASLPHWPKAYEVGYFFRKALFEAT